MFLYISIFNFILLQRGAYDPFSFRHKKTLGLEKEIPDFVAPNTAGKSFDVSLKISSLLTKTQLKMP